MEPALQERKGIPVKKKCTNPTCRRVFSLPAKGAVACPCCGRANPRLGELAASRYTPALCRLAVVSGPENFRELMAVAKYLRAELGLNAAFVFRALHTLPWETEAEYAPAQLKPLVAQLEKMGAKAYIR